MKLVLPLLLALCSASASEPKAPMAAKCSLIWQKEAPSQTLCMGTGCLDLCIEVTVPAPATWGLPPNTTAKFCDCPVGGGSGNAHCIGAVITTRDAEGHILAVSNLCVNLDCGSACEVDEAIDFNEVVWEFCKC